jgi:hypothetical protein
MQVLQNLCKHGAVSVVNAQLIPLKIAPDNITLHVSAILIYGFGISIKNDDIVSHFSQGTGDYEVLSIKIQNRWALPTVLLNKL